MPLRRRTTRRPAPSPRRRRLLWAGLLCAALGAARPAPAQDVPTANQAPILLKLLTYDRALSAPAGAPLRIGVLVHEASPASRLNGAEIVAAFDRMSDKTINGRPFGSQVVPWGTVAELGDRLRQAAVDVVYITAGQRGFLEAIGGLTRELGILSLGGDSRYVGEGASIGLGLAEGHPQILVHLESLHQEGHPLDARILRLCKVVTDR